MHTRQISADEAHDVRKAQLQPGPDGKERMLKVASAPTSWNAGTRSARFVMTSQEKDRYGDVVVTAGLDTTEFEKNPQAFLNHDSSNWPIGIWANVSKVRSRPPRMEGDLVLHEASGPIPQVDQAAWMIERGYMRASSIGFLPDFNQVERVLEPDGTWMGGLQFNAAELIECSLVGVPANPQALAKSLEENVGIAKEVLTYTLDNWALSPDGVMIERKVFEELYRLVAKGDDIAALVEQNLSQLDEGVALAVCEKFMLAKGKAIVSQSRIEAIERAAKQKRLHEQRQRDLDLIRRRGN